MIRIIAGSRRSRRIYSLPMSHHVKPISARMRKSVFDIIRPHITGAIFLDLYAGVGVVGLEALSRGAQKAVFVDIDPKCVKVVQKNIDNLGFSQSAKVLRGDVLKGLIWLKYYSPQGYDIVYVGPPYRDWQNNPLFYSCETIKLIASDQILSEYGFVIVQHHKRESLSLPDGFELFRSQKYGDTLVDFVRPLK